MRAGRQKNTILVCFVFQRKTSHFQIFSYARGGLGGRGEYIHVDCVTATLSRALSTVAAYKPPNCHRMVREWQD